MVRFLTLLCLLVGQSVYGGWSETTETGVQSGYGVKDQGFHRVRPYAEYHKTYYPDQQSLSWLSEIRGGFRIWWDAIDRQGRIDVRDCYIHLCKDRFSTKIGFQEIPWGETFGVFIGDLVNPRDLRDPLLNEPSWFRKSVFALNTQWCEECWSLQLVVVPIPRNHDLPKRESFFDILPQSVAGVGLIDPPDFKFTRWGRDAEYGGQYSYLTENGWEWSVNYYRHWNRNIVYGFEEGALKQKIRRVHTVGVSFNKPCWDSVLRGDLLLHYRTPWDGIRFGYPIVTNVFRGVLGWDRCLGESTVGVQYHADVWKNDDLHALSFQWIRSFFDDRWRGEVFIYQGINHKDRWIQPKVVWCPGIGWEVNLRADILWGYNETGIAKDGWLAPFHDKDRVFLWVKRVF